jgi:hypothetical protein
LRSPDGRSFSPLDLPPPCRHVTDHPRPQGLAPPESPLLIRDVSAADRSMLPWALDRTRPDACHALSRVGWVLHPCVPRCSPQGPRLPSKNG